MTKTKALIAQLKANEEDHEFYPTTDEILQAMLRSMSKEDYRARAGFLDIGAGNGKVFKAIQDHNDKAQHHHETLSVGPFYAIEKSLTLCGVLADQAFVIGTDFMAQSLMTKNIGTTFCNPPYSQYEEWTIKIIRESASQMVYLVIPQRWQKSKRIAEALEYRKADTKIVGSFDFEDSEDRAARAVVHLIRIELSQQKDDAFDRFFDETFSHLKERFGSENKGESNLDRHDREQEEHKKKFAGLVKADDYAGALVEMYEQEMVFIKKNYEMAAQLDVDLMREFGIFPSKILECLKHRLTELRMKYWRELFSHMTAVTDRLTYESRDKLIGTLNENGHVDFTLDNIYAVAIWIIKNANRYIDEQFLTTYESMISKANVTLYKSNQRVFDDRQWRYLDEVRRGMWGKADEKDCPSHFALEYRLVLHRCGGIKTDWNGAQVLDETGCRFLGALLTIAKNFGFNCNTADHRLLASSYHGNNCWTSRERQLFFYTEGETREILFEVRAHLNWNLHVRLNPKFAMAMNVEHGRLRGWINSPAEAIESMGDLTAGQWFGKQLKIGARTFPMLAERSGFTEKEHVA